MVKYGFVKLIDRPFDEVLETTKNELQKNGFGIITTIDLKEKFKEKLGIDFKNYTILGACNPENALKAIEVEENIGLLLPCNVIVYEKDGRTGVGVIKPSVAMEAIENPALGGIATEIEQRLKRAFDSI